ncbi:Phosphoethanolamine transferase for glucans (OPG), alkaline phosphatase superfamily [Rosenbergiella nectarea]|uniref:Phosphoethanolamine transferase for glucans (OPG), alkaline phosphatase superfamily n=1 Tax=Rosenbergiella nectarea TaxID=988801 RepID=A0A1H9DXZ8_9GAMM|nr:phosphoethanolamine transferase [Rosenbergiella nectarea]SEQ18202.1 Phosphoethanolamine transferase for glucans (OPG), alkaline phosphatase superfamily [Rosenbergiella nectarea]
MKGYFGYDTTSGLKPVLSRWDFFLLLWMILLNIALGYRINILSLLGLYLGFKLLPILSPALYKTLIVIYSIVGFIYAPTGVIYGPPDVNVVGSFLYTTPEESIGFIKQTPFYIFILSLIVLLLGLFLVTEKKSPSHKIPRRVFYSFIIAFLAIVAVGLIKKNRIDLPAYRFVSELSSAYYTVTKQNQSYAAIMQNKPIWAPIVKKRQYHTYLLIVGESVRRDYLHSFGGKFDNTPWLDQVPATIFTNYISAGPATVISLTNTLVFKQNKEKQLNNSIVTLAEKSGFETWWLSNQGVKSHSDSPIARIAKSANHTVFINPGKADYSSSSFDENLLPHLEDALNNPASDKLIILHLMGSHPRACDRTQGLFDINVGSKELSCYVKSIGMTDTFLSKTAAIVKRHTDNWTMMYFSDHGLSYVDRNSASAYLTHGDKTKENYQVPFFIINSDSTERSVVSQPRSALDFLTTFSEWLNIEDKSITNRCNMLSDDDCHVRHDVYDFNEKVQNYETLPSVP